MDRATAANLEENRDGESNNLSWNCGAEGPTQDQGVLDLRERQKRNFLATLLLSQGVECPAAILQHLPDLVRSGERRLGGNENLPAGGR